MIFQNVMPAGRGGVWGRALCLAMHCGIGTPPCPPPCEQTQSKNITFAVAVRRAVITDNVLGQTHCNLVSIMTNVTNYVNS